MRQRLPDINMQSIRGELDKNPAVVAFVTGAPVGTEHADKGGVCGQKQTVLLQNETPHSLPLEAWVAAAQVVNAAGFAAGDILEQARAGDRPRTTSFEVKKIEPATWRSLR